MHVSYSRVVIPMRVLTKGVGLAEPGSKVELGGPGPKDIAEQDSAASPQRTTHVHEVPAPDSKAGVVVPPTTSTALDPYDTLTQNLIWIPVSARYQGCRCGEGQWWRWGAGYPGHRNVV